MLLTVSVTVDAFAIEAVLRDSRAGIRPHFEQLAPEQRAQLAVDAWMIGLRAMANAHAQAQEARLADVSRTALKELDVTLSAHVKKSEEAIVQGLRRYFDPADGQVTERLRAFIDDQGALAKLLDRFVGPRNSVLAETLAKQVGEQSVLFNRLSPTDSEGVIKALETRIDEVLAANRGDARARVQVRGRSSVPAQPQFERAANVARRHVCVSRECTVRQADSSVVRGRHQLSSSESSGLPQE